MLTFADVPLDLADPEGRLQAWIDTYRPLDNLLVTPVSYRDGRDRPQWPAAHATGLPTLNWQTRPPRWQLNTLWWPTGASRFSIGLFVASKDTAQAILEKLPANGSGTLKLGDGQRTITPTMYLLPPRPIGSEDTKNPVMLLPLVDRRYFWQWARCGTFSLSSTSAWTDVRTQITTNLGVSVSANTPEDYEAPDWSEFTRDYENPALLLDGYAATIGQRLVAALNGSYSLQKWSTAQTTAVSNLTSAITAGGSILATGPVAPGHLSVVFPKRQGGIVQANGACHVVTQDAADYGDFDTSALGDAIVHTTFQADCSSRGGSPDNLSNLSTLATAVARDFYGWRKQQYSVTTPGIAKDWLPTGYDDYLWFFANVLHRAEPAGLPDAASFGEDAASYLCQTIIESLPPNFGTAENLAQSPSPTAPRTFRPIPLMRAQLTSGWTDPGGGEPWYATARLLYSTPAGVLAKDPWNVKVFDTLGIRKASHTDTKIWVAALPADSNMFELAAHTAYKFRGITNEAIPKGSSDKTVSRYLAGTTTDSGIDDTVKNEQIDIGSGKLVQYWEDEAGVKHIDTVECPPE